MRRALTCISTTAPTPTKSLEPTDEQHHILSLVEDTSANLIINALAGTGKTSTLKLIDRVGPEPMLYLAFNKRVVTEAEADRKAAYDDPSVLAFSGTTGVRTFNSLGHRIWQQACGTKLVLNPKKNSDLLREAIYDRPKRFHSEAFSEFFEITSAIALAKSLGYVPEGKFPNAKRISDRNTLEKRLDGTLSNFAWELLEETLLTSIKASYGGAIDYDDQIYMPALFGGTFPNFPLVVVDEAQDLNPCNHAMLRKLRRSRIITVGDSGQSIYAFRGAVTEGMETLRQAFEATAAELTVSFRCPEAIVRAVHWHRPQMKWIKGGGRAARLLNPHSNLLSDNCTIICRNNAPLFRLALQLLSCGRSVNVHGSDIGPRVCAIMRKLGDESMSRTSVMSAIDNWLSEKLAKQSSTAFDLADCMRVFARHGSSLSTAISYAESLFKQKGTIQLLTGHKAKGLEFPLVFHLDPSLCRDDEQDRNLRYVITTRSKDTLYEIDGREIRWPNASTQ
jgi:DNA helicase II / ATP-dependent DNA helicase PcrA